jgi:hypothetical protein
MGIHRGSLQDQTVGPRRGRRKTHRESEIVLSDTGPGIIIKAHGEIIDPHQVS